MSSEKQDDNRLNSILLALSKSHCIDEGNLDESLRLITEAIADALKIERTSIWFYNHDHSAIVSADLFESEERKHSKGVELRSQDFPAYFHYLLEERTLSAVDAKTNSSTFEFSEIYLKPLNIFSMLDAPIRIKGKMIGVICNEQKYKKRNWSEREELFVGNIADIIARAIQAKERKEAMEKIKEMNENLEKLVQERTAELETQRTLTANSSKMALLGEMASAIAHEINNPLTIILGTVKKMKVLETRGTLSSEEKSQLYIDIEKTTVRIVDIIKGLRFFARDASMDDLRSVSLLQIVKDTVPLCQHKLKLSDCELIIDEKNLDRFILCQPVSISQALLNLISNSNDALMGTKDKWVRVHCHETSDRYELRVSDSGPGISKELRDKIMLPFFTTKPIGKGTGLGLPIVKGIIEQHGGTLAIDEKSKNTCFVMSFPKAAANSVAS